MNLAKELWNRLGLGKLGGAKLTALGIGLVACASVTLSAQPHADSRPPNGGLLGRFDPPPFHGEGPSTCPTTRPETRPIPTTLPSTRPFHRRHRHHPHTRPTTEAS